MLFRYMFKRGKEKTSRWMWLAYAVIAVSYGFLAFGVCYGIYSVAGAFYSLGLLGELVTVIFAVACVAIIIFGLIPMISYLYFSRDTEFMMSLPVRSSTVFLAKLSVVYLTEIVVGALVMIPALVTVGIAVGLNAAYYVVVVLAAIVVPAVPMVLVSIIAIPLMYVVSFFRNKGALASVAMILLFGAVFGAYYAFLGKFASSPGDAEIDPEQFVASVTAAFVTIAKILAPLSSAAYFAVGAGSGFEGGVCKTPFGEFGAGAASAINTGVFVLSAAVLVLFAALISGAVYRRAASRIAEGGTKKTKAAKKTEKISSPLVALFRKEWRELLRTPAFAFQCLGGVVLCPIVIVFFMSSFRNGMSADPEAAEAMGAVMKVITSFSCILMTSIVGVSMNVGASTAFTREGKNFYVLKTIPVEYKTIVKAKLRLYLLISSITVVVSMSIGAIFAFDAVNFVCGLAFLLVYNYGYNCFCLYFDLVRPKLNWVTQNEAVKNNRNVIVPTLINIGVSIILVLVPTLLIAFVPIYALALALTWAVLFAVAIAVAVVFGNLLYSNCDRLFVRASV